MSYNKDPKGIETRSFEIITEELAALHVEVHFESPTHEAIVKRAIHTSADFEYYDNLRFTRDVVSKLSAAIRKGCTLYTDTQMVASGINKPALAKYNCHVVCLISDEQVIARAKECQMTRSMAAVDLAMANTGDKIFVVGNAPTALYRIMEHYDEEESRIHGVVGVPVGFVGAAESKKDLFESEIPAICALGRKGGSNIAASIINAILYSLE
jgi:precorrin-8X/cobalt-precorrin-8 methylmutase